MKNTLIALACFTALTAQATTKPPATTPAPSATAQAGAIAGAAALSSSSVRSTTTSTAAGGSASITGLMNMQGATLGGAGGSLGNVTAGGVDLAGARIGSDVTFERPTASAYAPSLTVSNGTCMGSSSAGGQGSAFGLSFGTTWTDTSCDIRYDAEALRAAGLNRAAQARLCQKPEIAKAMEAAGTACPVAPKSAALPAPAEVTQTRQPMPWQAGG